MANTNNNMSEIQLVVFDLASEHYGVDISDVREIMRMQNITKVPGAICFVEGVINLRGKVLPVLDLRKRLGLTVSDQTEESRIVVIDISDGEAGVIVDAVTEVLRVPNEAIDRLTMISKGNSDYLRGIAKLNERLIILLDLHKLLCSGTDSEAISKVLTQSAAKTVDEATDQTVVAHKSGNGNMKSVESNNRGNGKKLALA